MKIHKRDFVRAKVQRRLTQGEMLRTLRELHDLSNLDLANLTGIYQMNL